MNSFDLRQKFIKFFETHDHKQISASSLVPEDQTVLFTTAGMQQFKKYYSSSKEAPAKNVVTCQPCFRTSDIDEVGDETHLTFFEMLGNFSFGGYFKKEAIDLAYKFLTDGLGIEKSRIKCTIYKGDQEIPRDNESAEILESMKIAFNEFSREDNFWSLGTENSPGGPTVEFYIDNIEIWNLVFNEYVYQDGKYKPLETKGVDTGMGLERLLAVLNKNENIYETDLFKSMIRKIEEISGKKYHDFKQEFRIIADHVKAAVFALNDGVTPTNLGAGYVVRRLIRRAIVKANQIGIEKNFTREIAQSVIGICKEVYSIKNTVLEELEKEENKFINTLKSGLKEFEKVKVGLDGKIAFKLYESYGFPLEMTEELARENNIIFDKDEFKQAFKEHQEKSRTASAGMFKGGLAGGGEVETKYHTATHLLLAALRQVLDEHVYQKGSNITSERLRFDFSHPEKLTNEEIKKVEDLVNEKIKEDLPVKMEEMSLEDAKAKGVIGVFDEKYGNKVKVYSINSFSREICGGPHVKHTGELGHFKIIKEESSSSGVRRIKAILE